MDSLIVLVLLGQVVAAAAALVKLHRIGLAWAALLKTLNEAPKPAPEPFRYAGHWPDRKPSKNVVIDMGEPESKDAPWRGKMVFNPDGTTQTLEVPDVSSSEEASQGPA